MRISIVSKSNGVGLDRDYEIIKGILEELGHDVTFCDWSGHTYIKSDLNIHLEMITPLFLSFARKNIVIPNPEWFPRDRAIHLNRIDKVLCKTHDTFNIFSKLTTRCVYTSFTSLDMYNENVKKKKQFIHVAGRSSYKNSVPIFNCFAANKDLKMLHLLKYENSNAYFSKENIKLYSERVEETEMIGLMNESILHLCPSEYEGFGHYLNEAKSTGAVVITTNAAPMNEFINADNGVLINSIHGQLHNMGQLKKINPMDLCEKIKATQKKPLSELIEMGKKSRQSYLENDKFFRDKFKEVISTL
jgi:hypothetical protein